MVSPRMQNAFSRNKAGFALPTVILLGICASFVLLATAQLLNVSNVRASNERISDLLRASCESSLDWAVTQLSTPSGRADIDTGSPVAIPSSCLVSAPGANLSGTITVINTAPPVTSYLYNPLLDSTIPTNQLGGNGWRVVVASVTNGVKTRRVRIVCKPVYNSFTTTSTSTQTVTNTYQPPPQPLFTKTLFAKGTIDFSGTGASTDSYDSAQATNPTTFNTGATAKGDIGSNLAISIGNGTVNGNAVVTAGQGQGSVSVQGGTVAAGVQTSGSSNYSNTTYLSGSSAAPQYLPDAPTPPPSALDLGALTSTSSSRPAIISQPGDYIVSSITIGGTGSLQLPSTGIVNLYVQGAGSSISIGGGGLNNAAGIPGNVRVWYSGTTTVAIGGGSSMKAVIFAPNAQIKFNGNGGFYGAAIGQSVVVQGNGVFHYDEALGRSTQLVYLPPITTVSTQTTTTTSTSYNLDHMQAISWEELN